MRSVFLFCILIAAATAAFHTKPKWAIEEPLMDSQQSIFRQQISHDFPNLGLFNQRYWTNLDYMHDVNGPMIMYICGEAECRGISKSWMTETLAKKLGAGVVALEHRYYGTSLPYELLTSANMTHLTISNALEDLNVFMQSIESVLMEHGGKGNNKWVTVGGSYPGALSSFMRQKYPERVHAAIASSGVVEGRINFVEFDQQIRASAGMICANHMRTLTDYFEQEYEAGTTRFNALRAALKVDDVDEMDFWYLMADAMALGFQYGSPDALCAPLKKTDGSIDQLMAAYKDYLFNFFYKDFGEPNNYSTKWHRILTPTAAMNYRQWWWQKCSEVAYFQNAPEHHRVRSKYLTLDWHLNKCKAVFNIPMHPTVKSMNLIYGGMERAEGLSQIVNACGSQDPWSHVSACKTRNQDAVGRTVHCYNCGHCVDLRGCPGGCDKPGEEELQQERIDAVNKISQWVL